MPAVDLPYRLRSGQSLKILLLDRAKRGPTARIVEAAIERRQKAKGDSSCAHFSIATPHEVRRVPSAKSSGRVVLVTVGEPELSLRDPGGGRRIACESLVVANTLARTGGDKVCLIRSDAQPLSGVDVVAALAGSIAAVVDERLLLTDGVFDALLERSSSDQRLRSIVVIGKSAIAVKQLRIMLDEWEEGALGGDGTLDPACWRTAMALAQVDELRPIAGTGDRFSFVKLAQGLNLMGAATSFHLSQHDLRKALGMLASVWIDSSTHHAERVRLPAYAKAQGFPQNLPVLDGVHDSEVPKRLYDIARAMEVIERTGFEEEARCVVVRVPIRLFKNHI
jgi:hypothetical protein